MQWRLTMVLRRLRRAWIALVALLIAVGSPLYSSADTDAQTAPNASSPGASLVGISLSAAGVSLPGVGVSLPSVGVSLPSVGVSLPGVSVSTPEVKVATPEVSVSTPEVSVSTPSAPGAGSTETTAAGSVPTSPTGGGASGAGGTGGAAGGGGSGEDTSGVGAGSSAGGRSSSATGGGMGENASAAALSGPASAGTESSSPAPAVRSGKSVGAGSKRSPTGALRSKTTPERSHGGAGRVVAGFLYPRKVPAPGALRPAGRRTSNPLDTIGRHIPLPLPVPDWSKPIILALLLLAVWLGVRSRVVSRRAKRLEAQRVALLRDVGAMQAALVPVVPARIGGLALSVAYRPADGPAAGGDFYDVFIPERGKVAIVLGDVAGHGHRALTHAALTRYTLRAYLQAGLEPRAALALTGRVLGDRTLEHFATVAVAIYHAREGRLVYASAGHPSPILHGLQTREPLTMCASPPIGWTVPTGRRQTSVSLPPGAVACFFSDGLVEARCEQDLLGRERLSEILAGLGRRPDAAKLLERVRAAAVSTPDDMVACIVVPEMTVIPTRTHIEELEADARDLARGDVRRFLETCQVLNPGIEQAIERAGGIAAAFGTALLRVELAPSTATVTVTAPRSTAGATASQRLSQPAGEPSGMR
jgi:Stage II sporulation protein E (SpoIIE)